MKKIKFPDRLHLFRFKFFDWAIWLTLHFDCWTDLFIIYLTGLGEKRLILQISILDISAVWHEKDRWIDGVEESGGSKYRVSTRNPKYDNDKVKLWSWSIKDMKIETEW